jgi:hypothetical protein
MPASGIFVINGNGNNLFPCKEQQWTKQELQHVSRDALFDINISQHLAL